MYWMCYYDVSVSFFLAHPVYQAMAIIFHAVTGSLNYDKEWQAYLALFLRVRTNSDDTVNVRYTRE